MQSPQRDFNALFSEDFPIKYLRVGVKIADDRTVTLVLPFGAFTTARDLLLDTARTVRTRLLCSLDAADCCACLRLPSGRWGSVAPDVRLLGLQPVIEAVSTGTTVNFLVVDHQSARAFDNVRSKESLNRSGVRFLGNHSVPQYRAIETSPTSNASANREVSSTSDAPARRSLEGHHDASHHQNSENRVAQLEHRLSETQAAFQVLWDEVTRRDFSSTAQPTATPSAKHRSEPRAPTDSPSRASSNRVATLGDFLPLCTVHEQSQPLEHSTLVSPPTSVRRSHPWLRSPHTSPPSATEVGQNSPSRSSRGGNGEAEEVIFVHPLLPLPLSFAV
jgi:hypothetical protein